MSAARRHKKHHHEEHENHERWLISYADFITLLFAFFVVMYAISVVNVGKYNVLSEALGDAFGGGIQSASAAGLTLFLDDVRVAGGILTGVVSELAQAGEESEAEAPPCPACGEAMVKNGRRKRRLKSKEGKTLQLERQQWRCLGCGTTLFPPG